MANRTLRLSRPTVAPTVRELGDSVEQLVTPNEPAREVEYSDTDPSDFVAPDTAEPTGEQPAGEQPAKRRGRPAGSTNKAKRSPASEKESPESLADVLFSAHFMLAQLCDSELLELDEDESKKLGEAIARVNKYYSARGLSPKTLAWVKLCTALGSVYGPRAVAYLKTQKAAKNKGKVTVIDPAPAPAQVRQQPTTIEG